MSHFVQSLEARRLFAGDIAVHQSDGVVRLIASEGATVDLRVERVDSRSVRLIGEGVTIDGAASKRVRLGSSRLVMDFTRAANVRTMLAGLQMKRGVTWSASNGSLSLQDSTVGALSASDRASKDATLVLLSDSTITGDANIQLDTGDNDLTLTNTTVGGNLMLRDRGGHNSVSLGNSEVKGNASLATGKLRDRFTVENSRFRKTFALSAGGANDTILLDRSDFAGKLAINDGDGRDAIQTRLAYDFNEGKLGWSAGFADYATNELEDPISTWGTLPTGLDGNGWTLGATNRADDTVMYLTRPVGQREGVVAGLDHVLDYNVRFASNAPSGGIGAGGAPGEAVRMKVGGSAEPLTTSDEKHRLNLDVGDQGNSGLDATTAGNIANGRSPDDPELYVDLDRQAVHAYTVRSDEAGTVHLFVGTDSGYEGRTVLAYRSVDVTLRAVR